jgi:peroxiredoxin
MTLLKSLERLKTGDKAPEFKLKGIDGKEHSLQDFKDAKALLIIFMCNHCPYVKPKIETIKTLQEKYKDKGLIIVGINANESDNYPEDSFEGMIETAKEKDFNFPYLHDATQETAKSYGASCTPDPFLFDSEQKLVYHGRFDDALEPGTTPTTADMDDAIAAVLEGKKPKHEFLFSIGCSIKWKN